jgi:hypothetical protein
VPATPSVDAPPLIDVVLVNNFTEACEHVSNVFGRNS